MAFQPSEALVDAFVPIATLWGEKMAGFSPAVQESYNKEMNAKGEELAKIKAEWAPWMDASFKRADADGDGRLNRQEMEAWFAEMVGEAKKKHGEAAVLTSEDFDKIYPAYNMLSEGEGVTFEDMNERVDPVFEAAG